MKFQQDHKLGTRLAHVLLLPVCKQVQPGCPVARALPHLGLSGVSSRPRPFPLDVVKRLFGK